MLIPVDVEIPVIIPEKPLTWVKFDIFSNAVPTPLTPSTSNPLKLTGFNPYLNKSASSTKISLSVVDTSLIIFAVG